MFLLSKLMIRQPDFVSIDFAKEAIERTKRKSRILLTAVKFETLEEGPCVQLLHVGSYEVSLEASKNGEFAHDRNLKRISHRHREIYLSDARKVAPEKLRTVLRFQVYENK